MPPMASMPCLWQIMGSSSRRFWKKGNVVRNGIAIGEHPLGLLDIEMNEAGHVIPASEIEAEKVIAEDVGEFLHLIGERMGLDERHAFEGVGGETFARAAIWKRSRHQRASSMDSVLGM